MPLQLSELERDAIQDLKYSDGALRKALDAFCEERSAMFNARCSQEMASVPRNEVAAAKYAVEAATYGAFMAELFGLLDT